MKRLDVVVPTFHSKELIEIFIKSFEKFKPDTLSVNYIIVENSSDVSYRDSLLSLADDVLFVENPTDKINSAANAEGVTVGLKFVTSEYVFIAHCDTIVTNSSFFTNMFNQVSEGKKLIGTVFDPCRIFAIHISGLLVDTALANSVSYYPIYDDNNKMTHDTGDLLTERCRQDSIESICFPNTFNYPELIDSLSDKFKNFHVDRSLDENGEVMFMHLGRGIPKMNKTYLKPNRVYFDDWVRFCKESILEEI
jgi:hypothetical protein